VFLINDMRRVRSPDRREGIATLGWENETRAAIPLFPGACLPRRPASP